MFARFASCAAFAACLASIALLSGLTAVSARAADPAVNCEVAKQKAAARHISDKVKCDGTASKKGEAVDPACLTKADEKLDASFAKAEAKGGCLREGDAAWAKSANGTTITQMLANVGAAPTLCPVLADDTACQSYRFSGLCTDCVRSGGIALFSLCDSAAFSSCSLTGDNQFCAQAANDGGCGEECCLP